MSRSPTRAACLTAPAVGGIAVVQVVGSDAPALLRSHLHKRGPVDLNLQPPDRLQRCRLVDGEETIDDALVCIRRSSSGEAIVDLSLHGGPRIVQRALMMLQREGVELVEPAALLAQTWPAGAPLERDAALAMVGAQTRRVALWLASMPARLSAELSAVVQAIRADRFDGARGALEALLGSTRRTRVLLSGARVVLAGEPNSGKSTLANALAQREQAIVSDVPGTTRDWTEHPAAVEGVPLTVIDTAGIRDTADPLEQEAICRTRRQLETADVIVRVIDATRPGIDPDLAAIPAACPVIEVRNKADLIAADARVDGPAPEVGQDARPVVWLSARTGAGLDLLRNTLLEALHLPSDQDWPTAPFSPAHVQACREALKALAGPQPDRTLAVNVLEKLLVDESSAGSPAPWKV